MFRCSRHCKLCRFLSRIIIQFSITFIILLEKIFVTPLLRIQKIKLFLIFIDLSVSFIYLYQHRKWKSKWFKPSNFDWRFFLWVTKILKALLSIINYLVIIRNSRFKWIIISSPFSLSLFTLVFFYFIEAIAWAHVKR